MSGKQMKYKENMPNQRDSGDDSGREKPLDEGDILRYHIEENPRCSRLERDS